MQNLSRRAFTKQALGSLLTFSLLETLARHDLFADEIKPITVKWLASVNQLGFDVKDQKIKQVEWQKKIEELFVKVELPDLLKFINFDRLTEDLQLVDNGTRRLKLKFINFDRLTEDLQLVDNGARRLKFTFREVAGTPNTLAFGKQIFALKKGCSIVPHGHNNMTSAFLILQGEFNGRLYDRLADEKEHCIIKPTIDRKFISGECSTISDYKDNVHWFKATSDRGFIFDIHVNDVRPGSTEPTGRLYLDPNGEKLKDNQIRARKVGYEEAHKLYG